MLGRIAGNPYFHLALILILGLIAYSNSFDARFLWDEKHFIAANPAVKDVSLFLDPEKIADPEYYEALKNRYVGYLTFALNYQLHGLDVKGYHVFNFVVHILNSFLVYIFVLLTFRTPFLRESALKGKSKSISLLTALIFVSHPIQTEAVTYIFQRLASLMSFFYFLSLVLYARWRLKEDEAEDGSFMAFWRSNFLYMLSLIAAVISMKTKENAFTLPVVVTLYEFLFFDGRVKKRIWQLVPMLFTLLIIPLSVGGGGVVKGMATDYLFTEFRVIVTYVRLLFLPVNQNLDYDYPVYRSFFNPEVIASFIFSTVLISFAAYLYCRSRKSPASRPIAFGIFWFFITLSVESTVVRLPMVIDEYRLYLPSVGVFLGVSTGAFIFFEKIKGARAQIVAATSVIMIPIILAVAAHARNRLWRSEISLWEDVVKKSPGKARAHFNLGYAYSLRGAYEKAIEQYRLALEADPVFLDARMNMGFAYYLLGDAGEAAENYLSALSLDPENPKLHLNLALAYKSMGKTREAEDHLGTAKRLNPEMFEQR